MKSSTLATRLLFAAILLAALVYFGLSLTAYLMDPYKTTVAYNYISDNAVAVSGYVVREEEALSGSGELVYSSRSEGERVSAGGTAAIIYQSPQALEDANTLRSLEEQLEQLTYAQFLASGAQANARLDDEVTAALLTFRGAVANGSLSAAGQQRQAPLRGAQAQLCLFRHRGPGGGHRRPAGADQRPQRRRRPRHHQGHRCAGGAVLQPGGRL